MDGQNANLIATASEFIPSKRMSNVTASVCWQTERKRKKRESIYTHSFPFSVRRSIVFGGVQEWIDAVEHKCHSLFFHWRWIGVRELFQRFRTAQHMHVVSLYTKTESQIIHQFASEETNCALHDRWCGQAIEFGIFDWCICGKQQTIRIRITKN